MVVLPLCNQDMTELFEPVDLAGSSIVAARKNFFGVSFPRKIFVGYVFAFVEKNLLLRRRTIFNITWRHMLCGVKIFQYVPPISISRHQFFRRDQKFFGNQIGIFRRSAARIFTAIAQINFAKKNYVG